MTQSGQTVCFSVIYSYELGYSICLHIFIVLSYNSFSNFFKISSNVPSEFFRNNFCPFIFFSYVCLAIFVENWHLIRTSPSPSLCKPALHQRRISLIGRTCSQPWDQPGVKAEILTSFLTTPKLRSICNPFSIPHVHRYFKIS